MDLYKNIKERRQSLNMSQEDLAHLTGYTDRSSIAKIERGLVDLSHSKIELFAKVLRTTPGALLGYDSDEAAAVVSASVQAQESDDAVTIMRNALDRTGHFDEVEFTDDELMELMQYANFLIMKRIADRRG